MDQKKAHRKHLNKSQTEAYSKALELITSDRDGDLQPEEIKLLNLVKVIIEGGWIIDCDSMQEIVEMTGTQRVID